MTQKFRAASTDQMIGENLKRVYCAEDELDLPPDFASMLSELHKMCETTRDAQPDDTDDTDEA